MKNDAGMLVKLPTELKERLERASDKTYTSQASFCKQAIAQKCDEVLGTE